MEDAELLGGEAAAFEQRDGQRVAERELHQRRGGRRQAVRAGLAGARQQRAPMSDSRPSVLSAKAVMAISGMSQRRVYSTRLLQFAGLARPRQRQHHVVAGDHAEVAVAGLGRMDEEGRRAGRGERGGDLAADMAALAHAGDDDPAGGGADDLDGAGEGGGEPVFEGGEQRVEPGALGGDGAQRRGGGLNGCVRRALSRGFFSVTAMSDLFLPAAAPV